MKRQFFKLMIGAVAFMLTMFGCDKNSTEKTTPANDTDSSITDKDNIPDAEPVPEYGVPVDYDTPFGDKDSTPIPDIDYSDNDSAVPDYDEPAVEYGPIQVDYDNPDADEPVPDYDEPVAEYGCPSVDYKMDGIVTDTEGNPLKDIQIEYSFMNFTAKTTTNEKGEWAAAYAEDCGGISDQASVKATDSDGDLNGGTFQEKSLEVTLDHTEPGSGWDEGTYEKHGVLIKMDRMPSTDYGIPPVKFNK